MKLQLTSIFTVLLLFLYVGSNAQSQPGSKADSANPGLHSPPNKTGAGNAATFPNTPAAPAKTGAGNTATTNATRSDPIKATTSPDTIKAKLIDPSIPQSDDEFNIFLMAITIAFFGMVIGGALVGVLAVMILLLSLFALVSAGILSAGILTGLYRRSIAAGFKTILVIICSLGGIIGGTICFWLLNRIFHIHLISSTAALVGAFGGLLCGLLLGILLAGLLRIFMNYCRQRLSF